MTEGKQKEKRQEESGASSSLPLLTGLSLIKIKKILVAIAKFLEHLLCAQDGSKYFAYIL